MAAIPGWAYLASGLAMAFFSKWVEAKSKPGELALFFWIGVLFIVIGVGKIIYKYIFRKDKNSFDKSNNHFQSPVNNQFNSVNHSNKAHATHHSNASHHSSAMHQPNMTRNTHTMRNSDNTINHHNHTSPTLSHYHSAHVNNANVNNAVNKNQNFSSTSPVITKANSPQHVSIISCPFCGTKHYDYANFCMKCGKKLKL